MTIAGAGGCGKTRVAREVMDRIRDLGGTLTGAVVELAIVRSGDHVADAFLRAVGARERAGRTPTEILAASLSGRVPVLTVDNCEDVLAEVRRIATLLLPLVPELHVLATSREPLGIAGEQVFDLVAAHPS